MRARHPLSRTWMALQLERRWTSFLFGTGCWCSYLALVQLHQQLVPKRNDVDILPSCRAFQLFHRGCIAQINLKDREESELRLIHSLLCPLGLCERDTLYQELGWLCNLKEGGHHFLSGRAVGIVTRPSCNSTNSSSPKEMVSTFFQAAEPFKCFIEGVSLK